MGLFTKMFGDYSEREIKKILPLQKKVLELEEEYKALSDNQLKAKTNEFKERYKNGESLDDLLPEAFAACREAGDRVLSMRHFPVQIIGGIVLHQGRISEMRTGEKNHNYGKKMSEEVKDKIRKKKIGKTLSEEHKKKI